jgi:hypothetical protein
MRVLVTRLGSRDFLLIEGDENRGRTIPIDRITEIDLRAANGGSTNCVKIITDEDDDMQNYYYNYEMADMLREFLIQQGVAT